MRRRNVGPLPQPLPGGGEGLRGEVGGFAHGCRSRCRNVAEFLPEGGRVGSQRLQPRPVPGKQLALRAANPSARVEAGWVKRLSMAGYVIADQVAGLVAVFLPAVLP